MPDPGPEPIKGHHMGLLRVILAIGVVLGHTGGDISRFLFVPGDVAVQGFYMISGFYIALVLNEKYNQAGDTLVFYKNRFLRIFTTYWLFLAIAFLAELFSFLTRHSGDLARWISHAPELGVGGLVYLLLSNIFLFGQDAALFLGLDAGGLHWTSDFNASSPPVFSFFLIHPAWSLALELLFYVLAPFILRRSTPFVIGLAACSLGLRAHAYTLGYSQNPWSYRFFPFELSMFLAGALSYRLYDRLRGVDAAILGPALSLCLLGATLLYPLYSDDADTFFSAAKIGLYVCFFVSLPFLFKWTKDNRRDRWIGELSYPIYLGHMLIAHAIHFPAPNLRALVVIAVTILLAIGVVRYVEIPLERYRQRNVRAAHAAASAVPA